MGRPPKYNWEPIDRLIAVGVSAREISAKYGIPSSTIEMRILRSSHKPPTNSKLPQGKESGNSHKLPTSSPQTPHRSATDSSTPPETCPTEEFLKSQIYCNQTRGLLKDLERKSRDSVKLAIALQAETARFLTGKSNIRACDLAHVANVISCLERVGSGVSEEEVFGTIAAMMRFGWLDEERSAKAVVRVRESRDAVLEDLWGIVTSNNPSPTGTEAPPNAV